MQNSVRVLGVVTRLLFGCRYHRLLLCLKTPKWDTSARVGDEVESILEGIKLGLGSLYVIGSLLVLYPTEGYWTGRMVANIALVFSAVHLLG